MDYQSFELQIGCINMQLILETMGQTLYTNLFRIISLSVSEGYT